MALSALTILESIGLTAINILAPGSPNRNIGGLIAQVTVEEHHRDRITITEHPVEQSASITDHYYKNPSEVRIRCGWSNSSIAALAGIGESLLSGNISQLFTSPGYVNDIYTKLLALQLSQTVLTVVTARRTYNSMLLEEITLVTDAETENALLVDVLCKEVILVQTSSTGVLNPANMKSPETTAPIQSQGLVQTITPTTVNESILSKLVSGLGL